MNTEDEIFISKLNEIEKNMISKTSCYNEQKNTNLYICYYIDNDLNRRREIDLVLKLNTSNLLFRAMRFLSADFTRQKKHTHAFSLTGLNSI